MLPLGTLSAAPPAATARFLWCCKSVYVVAVSEIILVRTGRWYVKVVVQKQDRNKSKLKEFYSVSIHSQADLCRSFLPREVVKALKIRQARYSCELDQRKGARSHSQVS